ncbi:MAG: hypothetical protein M1814_005251 [Vezdaea aestivalis]|nr:MAG: hypothetical protein M1814_005251 [Vezdaea aestivalis]
MTPEASPPASSASSQRARTPLSLDLSSLPPLIQPSPPSNTILITNLNDPEIFHPTQIFSIRDIINKSAIIHTWSPLKSMRRIIVSFFTTADAIKIRQALDGQDVLGQRARIYFGERTPIGPVDNHLQAPQSQKLFFISPPPSPPHGWEMRNEEPPNKEVHAEDLASALARLHGRPHQPISPTSPDEDQSAPTRARSGSTTVIYQPTNDGDDLKLPAIAVVDTTNSEDDSSDASPIGNVVHTARPPVELM